MVPFGARAKTVPQLFRVGAAYGGTEGFMGTDGTLGERAIGGAVGTAAGGVVGAGAGKALQYLPRLGQYVRGRFGKAPDGPADPLTPGFDAILAARQMPRTRDVIDIGDVPAPGATRDPVVPVDTAYPGPAGMRDRDWIDIEDIPPPPGYTMDQPHAPMAMDGERGSSVSQTARHPDYLDMGQPARPLLDPMTDAQRRALAEGIDPRDVLPIPSNMLRDADELAAVDAGRFSPARAPHERGELTQRRLHGYNGNEVSHRGPVDLVGWLRLNGGLRDQGGELSHMGLTNRARSGDFVGQETRFGPLVNNGDGMNLDDAALRAWEAGYFPDHTERPGVNEFLDALRDTHEGRNRRFLPEDHAEIDRYHGARQARHDLEQQRFETGQPVYTDRSVPAGAERPFPPPQAYEEWPAGGPDFAGNINLNRLDSPQDIARALSTVDRRIGFDAATRGRVAHAETERLAADLGMTPETLLSRRRGQAFNAEEALAARQILAKSGNELVNAAKRIKELDVPGDEMLADFQQKLLRHVAIQEQVSGMTAEAGRALQQFRQMADSRAVRGDVLAAAVQAGGGRGRVQDAAEVILDAVEETPGKFNAVVGKVAQPRWRDKLTELYINNLLSGPQTHAVNITSNALTALAQIGEHATAAAIGKVRQALPGANIDRVVGSEIGARTFGLLQGAKEGARLFAHALRTGEPSDLVSKVEGQGMKAISGIKGEIIRVPTRLLTAEDEFFKGIARRMELNGLAVRQAHKEGLKGEAAKARIAELVANPPDDLLHASMDYARYLTFQQKLGSFASLVSRGTQVWPGLKLFLPFVRTPTNLLKFAGERSLAAPFLEEWRKDFAAGGARRDLAIAKVMLGTGLGAVVYEAALAGRVTGSAPSDPNKARLQYADGWQPYSIRVGDQWYSYKRMDPFSTTLGVAADLATLPQGMSERQRDDQVTLLVASIMGNLANKTWLSGISDIVGALTEPDRRADRLIQRLAGSLAVPAGVAQVARTLDPVQREAGSVGEYIQSRIPFASQSLLPRRDVWGQPIVSEGGIGPDIVSPVYTSTAHDDPVSREMRDAGVSIGPVPGKVGGQQLTPEQKNRYQAEAGQRAYKALQALTGRPGWQSLTPEAREDAATKAIRQARAEARELLFGKGAVGATDGNDPWAAFKPVGKHPGPKPQADPWADFKQVQQPDLVGELQTAIPGVRFTSGYRTPEYQADMRRRGYNPSTNSSHLDGSALDMLPPPGKSMEWLKGQVRKLRPDARLLIHDGHLHATFPGYYGAPVLGGANSAGIRNPNAGMPPPPPGFTPD
ncbi:MAG: hypothetical protein M0R03_06060 [Novosphingobium sp.]|nr:hypothetical protein [Novosphingobium sp.]